MELTRADGSVSKCRISANDFVASDGKWGIKMFFKPKNGIEYWEEELNAVNSRVKCPCCGKTDVSDYDICGNCSWENDPVQRLKPEFAGGANEMSLNEATDAYADGRQVY